MDILFKISRLKCSYDKPYRPGTSKIILDVRDFVIPKGKKVFIVGESGIGKSTILEILGMMNNTIVSDKDTEFLFYDKDGGETDIIKMWKRNNDKELSRFRLRHFNFIFQSTNLMKNFTAYENIALTRMLQGYTGYSCFRRASSVLSELGLGHIDESRMTQELSGGQQQRLAFARAVLPDFSVLFGDEPTGNLDSDNAERAMKLLSEKLNELQGSSAIIVSHDMHLSVSFADIVVKIRKEHKKTEDAYGEKLYYGVIDRSCMFTPDENRSEWSNGLCTYSNEDFERFLKNTEER